MNLILNLSM